MPGPGIVLILLAVTSFADHEPTDPCGPAEPASLDSKSQTQPLLPATVRAEHATQTPEPIAIDFRNADGNTAIPTVPGVVDLTELVGYEPPVRMSPNLAKRTVRVDTMGRRLNAPPAGPRHSRLVYSNDLGRSFLGPGGSIHTARIADDIFTTARSSSLDSDKPSCFLDKYVVRVTGDRRRDGSGSGDYTVKLALHSVCPGTFQGPIEGTQVEVTIRIGEDVESAGDMVEIEVFPLGDIPIEDVRYVAARFDRDGCGVQVGAPASVGFSCDRFDFPGSDCSGYFGGIPYFPHASFGVDVYARGACSTSHVGYRNSNHTGGFLTPGIGVRFAHQVQLGVPKCNVIGYELAFKGNGIIEADLRTDLDNADPEFGGVISGSRHAFFSSALKGVQVEYHPLPEPFKLTSTELFMTFRTTSSECGPISTGKPACFGETLPIVYTYHPNWCRWSPSVQDSTSFIAFDLTLVCEGRPPSGACCDMVLNDNYTCVGGPNDGDACYFHSECRICEGGTNDGGVCTSDFSCPDGQCAEFAKCVGDSVCREMPQMNCPFPKTWVEGGRCGPVCVGGGRDDQSCKGNGDCPGGSCEGSFCAGGINDGMACTRQADCPNGDCIGGPFPRPCGLSACCLPGFDDACEDLTFKQCTAEEPMGDPRSFRRGSFCEEDDPKFPSPVCYRGVVYPIGDFDRDGDVDLRDYSAFGRCFTGPDETIGPGCLPGDKNRDYRIELPDFRSFHEQWTGP